jgi:PAS domain S-box-containing protein
MSASISFDEIVYLAVEACPNGMIMTDAAGDIVLVNAEAERLFGYGRDELLGNSIDILIPDSMRAAHAGHRQHFVECPGSRRMGIGRDLYGLRKDGALIPVEVGLNPIRTRQGLMILSAVTDIAERKNAMERLAQQREELQRSNADLEQFAYVASHDLQEPLRMVATYSELLKRRYGGRLDEEADNYIGFTIEGATRMESLLRNLRIYTQVSTAEHVALGVIDANEVLRKTLHGLDVAIRETGAVVTSDALPCVPMHEFEMEQLFQNLISNAIRYRNSQPPRIHVAAANGDKKWMFSVRDNGIGIESKYKEQIFGMFKRLHTSSQYPGTGMGLAICQRIVERAGGRIWVESEPGCGSTFYFTVSAAGRN